MIHDWWKNSTTSSPIGGIGGHRAVGVMPNPIAPSAPQAPVISIGEAGRGNYPATPYNPPYGVSPYTPNPPIRTVTQNPMNPFGGGANISEEGAMSWWDKLKSNIDEDFLAAALGSLGDMGGGASRSGGGGGGGGGARVGGNVKPTGLMSPTLPNIPAQAPNPGFYTLLPRQQKDRYSGGF